MNKIQEINVNTNNNESFKLYIEEMEVQKKFRNIIIFYKNTGESYLVDLTNKQNEYQTTEEAFSSAFHLIQNLAEKRGSIPTNIDNPCNTKLLTKDKQKEISHLPVTVNGKSNS